VVGGTTVGGAVVDVTVGADVSVGRAVGEIARSVGVAEGRTAGVIGVARAAWWSGSSVGNGVGRMVSSCPWHEVAKRARLIAASAIRLSRRATFASP
jgi:hypothetical protein